MASFARCGVTVVAKPHFFLGFSSSYSFPPSPLYLPYISPTWHFFLGFSSSYSFSPLAPRRYLDG
jgi:hypothetical protein